MTALAWKVGDVTITRIPEIAVEMPLEGLLPEASPAALAPHRDWLEPHFLTTDGRFRLSIHGLVVDTGELRILVDTCLGPHPIPGFENLGEGAEDFLAGLAAAGYPRETIDIVLCTHLHFDHVGWNTVREGDRLVPAFPNARYLFARTEWEHWSTAGSDPYTPTFDATVRPVVAAGLADFVEADHKLCDSVRLVPTAGHTPGHVSVVITSHGERAIITGDATHHPVQWAEPDWKMPADVDSAEAAATRRHLADELADTSVLVIGTHYAPPCAGHLVRGPRGVWFRALLASACAILVAGCSDPQEPVAPITDAEAETDAASEAAELDPNIYRKPPELTDEERAAAYRAVEIVEALRSAGTAEGGGDESVLTVRNGTALILVGMDVKLERTDERSGLIVTEIVTCFSTFDEAVAAGERGRFRCGDRSAGLADASASELETLGLYVPMEWNGRLIAQQLGAGPGARRHYR